ncbi:NAD(P)-binding domain-containing protein [Streptomyces mirabilis]|nr:NAD(P)-binding domain-containing protein [Streptomyces mirabilis]
MFVRYGQRFQKRYVGDVEPARVASVDRGPSAPGFVVGLDGGRQLTAAAVVVATGLNGLAYIPKELLRLAPEGAGAGALVSHTSHRSDLSRYAGQRIAVIGGGQSALESAALLHEAEAHVQVLVRERSVRWGSVPQPNRPWPQRLAQPASPGDGLDTRRGLPRIRRGAAAPGCCCFGATARCRPRARLQGPSADQHWCDLIIAYLPAEEGLGLAIANRLRRAAGPGPPRSPASSSTEHRAVGSGFHRVGAAALLRPWEATSCALPSARR